jgi:hypothetical protein
LLNILCCLRAYKKNSETESIMKYTLTFITEWCFSPLKQPPSKLVQWIQCFWYCWKHPRLLTCLNRIRGGQQLFLNFRRILEMRPS